jgi:hypothetical protein
VTIAARNKVEIRGRGAQYFKSKIEFEILGTHAYKWKNETC